MKSMNRLARRGLSKGLVFAAAAAAASPALLWPTTSRATLPTVTFDLRVHATGEKDATVYRAGDALQLDLYATVTGLDSDPTNDRISIGSGIFKSSTGGQLGDLLGLSSPAPFSQLGSDVGVPHDQDSDGDLDIGISLTSNFDFYAFRASPTPDIQPDGGFLVGRVRFTAKSVIDGLTQINFTQKTQLGNILVWPDGADGTNGHVAVQDPALLNIAYGAPVTIHGNPNVDPGPVTTLSGSISGHQTISTHISSPVGGSLIYSTGVDVLPGGTLDAPAGTVRVNANDATSGNAGGSMYLDGLRIATSADGTFTQSAGFLRAPVTVGAAAGHTGTFNITGGTFEGAVTVGTPDIGDGSGVGVGYFHVTGGNNTINSLAVNSGSTFEVGGGNSFINTDVNVGSIGNGTFIHSAGTTEISGKIELGTGNGAGVLNVTGGTLTANRTDVGNLANSPNPGQANQSGGTFFPGSLILATQNLTAPSVYNLTDGHLRPTILNLYANSVFNQTGGDIVFTGAHGTVDVSSSGPISGTGPAQYLMSGGSLSAPGVVVLETVPFAGAAHAGGFVQTGGTVNAEEIAVSGEYDYLGGILNVAKRSQVTGTMDFGGAAVSLNFGNNCFAGFNYANTKILNATNATFTGGVGSIMEFAAGFDPLTQIGHIQTQGIVHVAGQPLTIPASQRVGGTGTITGDVTNNGVVAPGNSPGAITISGNYVQGSSADLQMEIAGKTPGDEFDTLTVTGAATIGGTLDVSLLDGFVPQAGDSFAIIGASSLTGTFANVTGGKVNFPGGRFDVLYSPTGVTLTNFQAVPEPTTMLGISLAGAIGLLRRRRRGARAM